MQRKRCGTREHYVADSEKKPVINLVPAILTGAAALIAALTTVYVNVRNDLRQAPEPAAATTPATPPEASAPVPASVPVQLQLQRIAVHEDGAVGSANWRFAIQADGQPLFGLEQESMTSEGGRNIVVVEAGRNAHADLELKPGKPIAIAVKGWRDGWLKKTDAPRVSGEAWLDAVGAMRPLEVTATDPKQGSFTFYFAVAERKQDR